MRKYTKYTKELLEPIVSSSISYAECLRKLGLVVAGGNYKHLQDNINRFGISTSHMLHEAANQGREFKPFDELKRPASIKNRLTKERGYMCESCGITNWKDKPITLELHHIDGNNRNNLRENLELLCPNCHSQTHNWRR